jgi:hypothetical protein
MNPPQSSTADDFSLVIGGPFYAALRRMRLVDPSPNIGRRIAVVFMRAGGSLS